MGPPRHLGWARRVATDSIRSRVLICAGVLLGVDAAVVGLSYAGVSWPVWLVPLTFVPLFPIYAVALLLAVTRASEVRHLSGRRRVHYRELFRGTPVLVVVLCAIGFYGGWLLLWANLSSTGQPITRGGAYFLNDHGRFTEVSLGTYTSAVAEGIRLFASGSLGFASGSFLLAFPPIRRRAGELGAAP